MGALARDSDRSGGAAWRVADDDVNRGIAGAAFDCARHRKALTHQSSRGARFRRRFSVRSRCLINSPPFAVSAIRISRVASHMSPFGLRVIAPGSTRIVNSPAASDTVRPMPVDSRSLGRGRSFGHCRERPSAQVRGSRCGAALRRRARTVTRSLRNFPSQLSFAGA